MLNSLATDSLCQELRDQGSSPQRVFGSFITSIAAQAPTMGSTATSSPGAYISHLLSSLPVLSEKVSAMDEETTAEFLQLKTENSLVHLNDAEEIGAFRASFASTKKSLSLLEDRLNSEKMFFKDLVDRYSQSNQVRKEKEFLVKTVQRFIQTKEEGPGTREPDYAGYKLSDLLEELQQTEFLKKVLKWVPEGSDALRVQGAQQKLIKLAALMKEELKVRLRGFLETKALSMDREQNYKNISSIHQFFAQIGEKATVEEQIFDYLIGSKSRKQISSKEDIRRDFLRYLILLKKQLKNISKGEGLFLKIFGGGSTSEKGNAVKADSDAPISGGSTDTTGYLIFNNFCLYVSKNYIGELASSTLKLCQNQGKYSYYLEMYDLFNVNMNEFLESVNKFSGVKTYVQEIQTCFIKYMAPHSREYFSLEQSTFEKSMDLYYKMLKKVIDSCHERINEPGTSHIEEAIKPVLSKEKTFEIITVYKKTMERVSRNIPSYSLNDSLNVVVGCFFEMNYKYYQDTINMIKAKVLSTTDNYSVELSIYSLLGVVSQTLELISGLKVEIVPLFNSLFHIKELDKKYKLFDSEMKNELNNCISLLLERLFENIKGLQTTGKSSSKGLKFLTSFNRMGGKAANTENLMPSKLCLETINLLEDIRQELFKSFTESLRRKIYANIASRLIAYLKKTLPSKEYYSSNSKHILVDMQEYEEYISRLDSPQISENFEGLKKLVRLLSLPANQIEVYLESSKLRGTEKREIIEAFVKCSRGQGKQGAAQKKVSKEFKLA